LTQRAAKTAARPGAAREGYPARRVAALLLSEVLDKRRALDEVLSAFEPLTKLDARDRSFVRALTSAALRRLGVIDALLDRLIEKPIPAAAATARHALRLGVAQLLFMRVPAHAAVNASVRLAAEDKKAAHYKGLTNAVLRRVEREGAALLDDLDSERAALPAWLWQDWTATYGEAATRAIVRAQTIDEPPLDLSLKDPSAVSHWAEALEAQTLPFGTLRRALADPSSLPGFEDGAWWVQDAAAAIPVRLLGDVADRVVLDLCAAPGGKTAQLAAAGAQVVAVDRSAKRLERVGENLARLGLSAASVAADAVTWRPPKPVSRILLDAPCSATGTLRRHPDVAWLKTPKDVAKLAQLQDRLLDAAREMLQPGGTVVYCTCSLQAAEGPERVAAALQRHADLRLDPVRPEEVPGLTEAISADGTLRILPSQWSDLGGLDGFFAARLTRV